jgi:uncharacterized protein (DUF2141 family)
MPPLATALSARPTHRGLRALAPATLAVALLGAAATPAPAATLTIDIQHASAASGNVMVALYGPANPWLKQPLRSLRQSAASGSSGSSGSTTTVVMPDLPDGDYAVSLFLDRNGNGQLDTNPLGVPTEPYGFSNDASGSFGPPSFDQARFTLRGDTRAVIRLP